MRGGVGGDRRYYHSDLVQHTPENFNSHHDSWYTELTMYGDSYYLPTNKSPLLVDLD